MNSYCPFSSTQTTCNLTLATWNLSLQPRDYAKSAWWLNHQLKQTLPRQGRHTALRYIQWFLLSDALLIPSQETWKNVISSSTDRLMTSSRTKLDEQDRQIAGLESRLGTLEQRSRVHIGLWDPNNTPNAHPVLPTTTSRLSTKLVPDAQPVVSFTSEPQPVIKPPTASTSNDYQVPHNQSVEASQTAESAAASGSIPPVNAGNVSRDARPSPTRQPVLSVQRGKGESVRLCSCHFK